MEIRKCGRTDLMLSRLSLGCLYLSDMGTGAFEDSKESTYYALDKGINFIDTAPSYGNSEMMLGHVLRGYSGKTPMISTKIGMPPAFNPQSRQAILDSVEKSMSDIGCDVIDLLYIHEPERAGQMRWFHDYNLYDEHGHGSSRGNEAARLGQVDTVLAVQRPMRWQRSSIPVCLMLSRPLSITACSGRRHVMRYSPRQKNMILA